MLFNKEGLPNTSIVTSENHLHVNLKFKHHIDGD